MTFVVRISDPTCPNVQINPGDSPEKILGQLHDNPTVMEMDLDGPDEAAFCKWADMIYMRTIHLEEGEELSIKCIRRSDR